MALAITLSDGTTTVNLETKTNYGVRRGSRLGVPAYNRIFSEPWGRGFHPLVGVNVGNRTAEFVIRQTGSSLDNWITVSRNVHNLLRNAEWYHESGGIRGAAVTLSVQLDGATNATVFDVLGGELHDDQFAVSFMQDTSAPKQTEVPLTLILKPYGRPSSATTTTSGTLGNGDDTYTLSAPAGDREAPVKITFQSGAASVFQRVILARRTRGTVANFTWLMECETGDHGDYAVTDVETSGNFSLSNVSDAAAHGGSKLRIAHTNAGADADADIIQFEIQANLADHYGRFRVFLHSLAGSGDVAGIRLVYGGDNGKDISNARVDDPVTADSIIDLGIMEIPHRQNPLGVTLNSFKFRLQGTFNSGTFNWDIDNIYLIPVDEQYMDVQTSVAAAAQDKLVNDNTAVVPMIYLTDSADVLQPEHITANADTRFTVVPGKDNLWLCLFAINTDGVIDMTDTFTLSFSYYPLYELFR